MGVKNSARLTIVKFSQRHIVICGSAMLELEKITMDRLVSDKAYYRVELTNVIILTIRTDFERRLKCLPSRFKKFF